MKIYRVTSVVPKAREMHLVNRKGSWTEKYTTYDMQLDGSIWIKDIYPHFKWPNGKINGKHDDGNKLLRDAAGQMPESVEDPLPVMQVQKAREAAHGQDHQLGGQHRRVEPLRPRPAQGANALEEQHAGRQA